eukprot:2270455-Rhodomonas_salina.1
MPPPDPSCRKYSTSSVSCNCRPTYSLPFVDKSSRDLSPGTLLMVRPMPAVATGLMPTARERLPSWLGATVCKDLGKIVPDVVRSNSSSSVDKVRAQGKWNLAVPGGPSTSVSEVEVKSRSKLFGFSNESFCPGVWQCAKWYAPAREIFP